MKKIIFPLLIAGAAMGAYGMDEDGKTTRDSRQVLSPLPNLANTTDLGNPYPECSQHIKAIKEQARRKGIEEGLEKGEHKAMLVVAIRMFKKAGTYTPDIMELTGITEGQLGEALAKSEGK